MTTYPLNIDSLLHLTRLCQRLKQSCHFNFNLRCLDRYLVMAADGGVTPVVVLTKTDLISAEELARKLGAIQQTGSATEGIPLSNITGAGFARF